METEPDYFSILQLALSLHFIVSTRVDESEGTAGESDVMTQCDPEDRL